MNTPPSTKTNNAIPRQKADRKAQDGCGQHRDDENAQTLGCNGIAIRNTMQAICGSRSAGAQFRKGQPPLCHAINQGRCRFKAKPSAFDQPFGRQLPAQSNPPPAATRLPFAVVICSAINATPGQKNRRKNGSAAERREHDKRSTINQRHIRR